MKTWLNNAHKGGVGGHRIEHFYSEHGVCVFIRSVDTDD